MTAFRISPSGHEEVVPTARKRLSEKERDLLLSRQNNNCPRCGDTLTYLVLRNTVIYGPMIDEHILPLDLGGANDLSNRALYCVPCAKAKTRDDRKRIDKARRLRTPRQASKRKLQGRGFDKSRTRHFDGSVTPK